MEQMDKVNAVSRMQKRIIANLDDVTLDDLSVAAGYSKYYAVRIFKEAMGKTPGDSCPQWGSATIIQLLTKQAHLLHLLRSIIS